MPKLQVPGYASGGDVQVVSVVESTIVS